MPAIPPLDEAADDATADNHSIEAEAPQAQTTDAETTDAETTDAETIDLLTRRVRMLGRRLERAENEARDLRRSGFGGGSADPETAARSEALQRRVDELEASTSWRVTRPLRDAKIVTARARPIAARVSRRLGVTSAAVAPRAVTPSPTAGRPFNYSSSNADEALLQSRLRVVEVALGIRPAEATDESPASPEQRIIARVPLERASWWLIAVGYAGALPTDELVDLLVEDAGAGRVEIAIARLRALRAESTGLWQVTAPLRLVGEPFVDATFAATTTLHTGVQRVVRSIAPFWARDGVTFAVLDPEARAWRAPTSTERHRLLEWDDSLIGRESSAPDEFPSEVLVPWNTVVVIPELRPKGDLELLRAVASASPNELALIVYDLIPVSAAEFVPEGVTATFGSYVSLIKFAARVSGISESAATEFRGLGLIYSAQGLAGPDVRAHLLPIVPPRALPSGETAAALVGPLRIDPTVPLVLQVGSIGPHKNQRATLAAASALWASGSSFEVIFVAPNSWAEADFAAQVAEQRRLGRPVSAVNGISEDQLWALYREAHVVVLPSYVEGYGLPIAEALSVGTPVITSDFGSMAEIAAVGGAITIDPRDSGALAGALSTVLDDPTEYAALRAAAAVVPVSSWQDYAAVTWNWLVRGEDD